VGREFVDLIAYQRGFQASSKVVQTADELYGELVNLRR
jgi:flagellar hook protein FlgE